eukprot:6210846-Pleurochrysis_carterae.AAC.1
MLAVVPFAAAARVAHVLRLHAISRRCEYLATYRQCRRYLLKLPDTRRGLSLSLPLPLIYKTHTDTHAYIAHLH